MTLSLPSEVLTDLSELDAATNERTIAVGSGNSDVGPAELLYGVPEAHIVNNAAFSHHGPHGGRFHSPQRGAWYAGVELESSVAEVAFHKRRFLEDARLAGEYAFIIKTSSPISQVNFIFLTQRVTSLPPAWSHPKMLRRIAGIG